MLSCRRASAVSNVSDVGSTLLNEDDLSTLSEDQLLEMQEEVKKSIEEMQAELDLFHRYLSSQSTQQGSLITKQLVTSTHPSPLARQQSIADGASSVGSQTLSSSLDVKSSESGLLRRTSSAKARITDQQKCSLWQRELEVVKSSRKKKSKEFVNEINYLKVKSGVFEESVKQFVGSLCRFKTTAGTDTILDSAGRPRKLPNNGEKLSLHQTIWFVKQLIKTCYQAEASASTKCALLSGKIKQEEAKVAMISSVGVQPPEIEFVNLKKVSHSLTKELNTQNNEEKRLRKEYEKIRGLITKEEGNIAKGENKMKNSKKHRSRPSLRTTKVKSQRSTLVPKTKLKLHERCNIESELCKDPQIAKINKLIENLIKNDAFKPSH